MIKKYIVYLTETLGDELRVDLTLSFLCIAANL
jgi:hypothetical protein